jgi:hypothetical protein
LVDGNNGSTRWGGDFTMDEEELDVYMINDEWGTLVTDELKGIFKPIVDAIAK